MQTKKRDEAVTFKMAKPLIEPLQVGSDLIPPRLQSLIFWEKVFGGEIEDYRWVAPLMQQAGYTFPGTLYTFMEAQEKAYRVNYCHFCGGAGTRTDHYGHYYCIHYLLKMRADLERTVRPYASRWSPTPLTLDLTTQARIDYITNLKKMLAAVEGFAANPVKSLVLSGPTGVGKTRMLLAVVSQRWPWFIYLTAAEFADNVFRALSNGNLDEVMHVWKTHPGLAFDDLGIEYAAPIVHQKLEDLLNFRLSAGNWWDTPTILSTNYRKSDIGQVYVRGGISRLGSRLQDTEKVVWVGVEADDYRTKGKS